MLEENPNPNLVIKREIPKDHSFDPKALRPMSRALWATSVALGHALAAYKQINRLKSGSVSPDGRLGGKGYILTVVEARKRLFNACESLSSVADTLHDEIKAPHWKPRLAELDRDDREDISRYVGESEEYLADPEAAPEQEMKELEEANNIKKASAYPVDTLPGGPRVDSREPYDPTYGDEDDDSFGPPLHDWDDDPDLGPPLNYGWDDANTKRGSTGLPTDDTPSESFDYGLGFGAKGQGTRYPNPSGEPNELGTWGPHSELPHPAPAFLEDTRRQASAVLPGDGEEPVARSDYYRGRKNNLVQSQTELPQEPTVDALQDVSMMNTFSVQEDVQTPYVRYDYTTHTYRRDPLHEE